MNRKRVRRGRGLAKSRQATPALVACAHCDEAVEADTLMECDLCKAKVCRAKCVGAAGILCAECEDEEIRERWG